MISPKVFCEELFRWWKDHQRTLPWRETDRNMYQVWVSEVMLQQTQAQRVAERFYPRFMERFPTLNLLSSASWEEVFPYWEGLGYYQRGRHLLATAKIIQNQKSGQWPQTPAELQKLPGIGPYTARSILVFSQRQSLAAIDTNLEQILRKVWPRQRAQFSAEKCLAVVSAPDDWHQAMMDLGDAWRKGELPSELKKWLGDWTPKRQKKPIKSPAPKFIAEVGVACIHHQGKYLVQTRPEGKNSAGKWEFPGGKREAGESLRACVKREIEEELGVAVSVRPWFYQINKTRGKTPWRLRFHRCQIQHGTPQPREGQELAWVEVSQMDQMDFLATNLPLIKRLKKFRG